MSDGEALRAAIRANPTEVNARLVFADWLDENSDPGGDLVRLLVELSLWEAVPKVVGWFHQHHDWPMAERFILEEWVPEALARKRWPDSVRLQSCATTIATRILPVAEHGLQPHEHSRLAYTNVLRAHEEAVPARISAVAANIAEMCLSTFGDGAGDASHQEYCEQAHVIAWAWLDLPPLRPAPTPFPNDTAPVVPESQFQSPPVLDRRAWWRRLFGN